MLDGTSNKTVEGEVEIESQPKTHLHISSDKRSSAPQSEEVVQAASQSVEPTDADKMVDEGLTSAQAGPQIEPDNVKTMITFFLEMPIQQINVGTDLNYEQVRRLINGSPKSQRFVTIPSPEKDGRSEEISIQLDKVICWSAAQFKNSKIIQPNMGVKIVK